MWFFTTVVRIEQRAQRWAALVLLNDSGRSEAFLLYFPQQPSPRQATEAGFTEAVRRNEQAAADEFELIVFSDMTWPGVAYQTTQQFAARFRATYKTTTALRCAKMAYWVIEAITRGDFTDAQVRGAFGLDVPTYATLKAKMQALRDNYAAILAAAGE